MSTPWSEANDGYQFRVGSIAGRLALPARPGRSVCALLTPGPDCPLNRAFELGPVRWVDQAGVAHEAPVCPERLCLAQPTLELTSSVAAEIGLQLVARLTGSADGLSAELGVQTEEPVEDLSLDVGFAWQQAQFELATVAAGELVLGTPYDARTGGLGWLRNEQRPLLSFRADLMERGVVRLDQQLASGSSSLANGRLRYSFFCRPLEKGILLVARLTVQQIPAESTFLELGDGYRAWLQERSFL